MSPVNTVSCLILIVALPFLAAMIALYITCILRAQRKPTDDLICDSVSENLVSIIRLVYDDQLDVYKSACFAVKASDSTALAAPDCFKGEDRFMDLNDLMKVYFVSSGSSSWLNRPSIQDIVQITEQSTCINGTVQMMKLIRVDGSFTECIKGNKSGAAHQRTDDPSSNAALDDLLKNSTLSLTYREMMLPQTDPICKGYTSGVFFNGNEPVAVIKPNCRSDDSDLLEDEYRKISKSSGTRFSKNESYQSTFQDHDL
ncbi:unnamed protein product [Callosobruchus maculatus]|uniref:Uncharacterized protein n=1 Tax=Callosobruchus maculatus TaxID=64391 RepID=A0A653CDQ9_CALMS|nr:unnamed protein product [Callosobruchus maculatus]